MPGKTNWAVPLAAALENPICRAVAIESDDSLLLAVAVEGLKEELEVIVRRAGARVVCLARAFRVSPFAPHGVITSLCRLSNGSGGEFVVYPTENCEFHGSVRVEADGHDELTVKACLLRLLERLGYWRDRLREIPLE